MKRFHLVFSFLILLALVVIIPVTIDAFSKDDIVFPAVELGSCENENECRAYCDEPDNIDACLDFAEQHGLLDQSEIEHARKFQAIKDEANWPGGCDSEASCEAYCNDIAHINECLVFAEEHGFIDDDELDEARRVQAALDGGAELPGGCTNKDACEVYCEDPDHIDECLAFAEAAGFLSDEEIAEAQRFMQIMSEGRSPGGCRGERECFAYCEDEAHFEECIAFAEEAGFISPEEAEIARRTGGRGPGGCVQDECDAYCEDSANQDECLAFALEHGFLTEEEFEHIKGTGGFNMSERRFEGPGGCDSEESCRAYCSEGDNLEECGLFFGDFGGDHDDGSGEFPRGEGSFDDQSGGDPLGYLNDFPPDVRHCVEESYGLDRLDELRALGFREEPIELGQHIQACFESASGFTPPEIHDGGDDRDGGSGEGFIDSDVHKESFESIGESIDESIPTNGTFSDEFVEEFERQKQEIIEQEIQRRIEAETQRIQDEQRLLDEPPADVQPDEAQTTGFRGFLSRMLSNVLSAFSN